MKRAVAAVILAGTSQIFFHYFFFYYFIGSTYSHGDIKEILFCFFSAYLFTVYLSFSLFVFEKNINKMIRIPIFSLFFNYVEFAVYYIFVVNL